MSTFERDNFRWRETYFVLFQSDRRPSLEEIREALRKLNDQFRLENLEADPEGRFESLTLFAPGDFAALDIAYVEGEEVIEQVDLLADDLQATAEGPDEANKLARLKTCNARFDVMHFQQVDLDDSGDEDELDEMFDPSALIVVLEGLSHLTDGVGVDPQAGALM